MEVAGEEIARIGPGWLVLVGVGHGDTQAVAEALANKIVGVRAFEDAQGRTNLSAADVGAELLVVSQFTLLADLSRGRRPGFTAAAPPDQARVLVGQLAAALRHPGFRVAEGRFGSHMRVSLVNDGPFTLWLEV